MSTATLVAPRGVDHLLATARARLQRVDVLTASVEQQQGALVVDIRPYAQRQAEGEVPHALVLERNVLEWRLDPHSDARVPEASADLRVLVLCSEGYTSSLAAVALVDVGVHRATDIVGGFAAWRAAGLPTVPGGTAAGDRSGVGGIVVDPLEQVAYLAGVPLPLTRAEFRLLAVLAAAEGRVVPRERARLAAGIGPGRAIDVLTHRLRRRLGPAASAVVTVRGVGLRLLPGAHGGPALRPVGALPYDRAVHPRPPLEATL